MTMSLSSFDLNTLVDFATRVIAMQNELLLILWWRATSVCFQKTSEFIFSEWKHLKCNKSGDGNLEEILLKHRKIWFMISKSSVEMGKVIPWPMGCVMLYSLMRCLINAYTLKLSTHFSLLSMAVAFLSLSFACLTVCAKSSPDLQTKIKSNCLNALKLIKGMRIKSSVDCVLTEFLTRMSGFHDDELMMNGYFTTEKKFELLVFFAPVDLSIILFQL